MVDDDGGKPPRRSRLGQILEQHPEARPRLSDAIGGLLKVVLAAVAVIGVLAIWHLRRRARLIRNRLGPPRDVRLDDFDDESPGKDSPPSGAQRT